MSHDFTRLDMIKIELAAKYHAKLEKAGNFLERSEVISDLISEAMDAASPSAQVTDSEIEKAAEEYAKGFGRWLSETYNKLHGNGYEDKYHPANASVFKQNHVKTFDEVFEIYRSQLNTGGL